MSRAPLLLVIALPLLFGAFQREAPPAEQGHAPNLRPGLSPEQVVARLGQPQHVCRQILAHRYLEQWLYHHPHFLRLEFHCPRGEKPQLQTWRPLAQPDP